MLKETRKKIRKHISKDVCVVRTTPYRIYHHLVGERFSHTHKMTVGIIVGFFGVFIAQNAHHYGILMAHVGDFAGFMLHGAGIIPFFEFAHKKISSDQKQLVMQTEFLRPEFSAIDFDKTVPLTPQDVTRIESKETMYLQKGDVVLVDSDNVPELGFHYIIVTGGIVKKPHGMRPETVSFAAPRNKLIPSFEKKTGLVALKLNRDAAKLFRDFYGIRIENGEVVFPAHQLSETI